METIVWRVGRVTFVMLLILASLYLSGCQKDNPAVEGVPTLGAATKSPQEPDLAGEATVTPGPESPAASKPPTTEPKTDPDLEKKTVTTSTAILPTKNTTKTPIHPFYGLDGTPPSAPGLAMRGRVFDVEPEKIAYLTFDDGPYPQTTPRILKILQDEGVKATFFVLGSQVEKYPDLLKMEYDQGEGIGNHSYSHNYKSIYRSPEAFLTEIRQTEEIIFKAVGVRPRIVRAPGGTQGHFNVNYYNSIDAEDYLVYDWNVSSGDAAAPLVPADQLIHNIKTQMPNKSRVIILMHDAGAKTTTVDALPQIIQYLKQTGYTFGVITPKVAPILFPGGFNS